MVAAYNCNIDSWRATDAVGDVVEKRSRILLLGPAPGPLPDWTAGMEVYPVTDPGDAIDRLHSDTYDAVLADPSVLSNWLVRVRRNQIVLGHMQEGVAVLDPSGIITWANPAFLNLCIEDPISKQLQTALGAQTVATDNPDPISTAREGTCVSYRVFRTHDPIRPYLDVTIRPVLTPVGRIEQLVAIIRNVSSEVEQQRKLDALHQAGRELAGLDPDQLAEMNLPTRVELLKQNLRRYIRDLLHYDIIEVRILDRRTGELKPLLEDGMTDEASQRKLFALPTGNGVTGYVAATGRSYLCADTATDPLYLEGATGARSSMTVPLIYHDEVIGTLNVESPRQNGFGPDDLQFTELFSKEIASALHTLDLLTAQQSCTAAQSIDAINREIALPVDDLLASTAIVLKQLSDADPVITRHLRRILSAGRSVKESIRKVAHDLAVEPFLTESATPLAGKRVLVVDSDERIRRSAHVLLNRLGAEVETTSTASEGVAVLAQSPFDAVFMEIKPPDMGGFETYRRLREARPGVTVAMTTGFGYDSGHAIVKARQEGMKYVLFKPFRQDQVVKAVLDGATPPEKVPS